MASNLDAASLFRVDGIVAVVTGGGTGIGLTMARALAINGAKRVYLLGRRLNILEEAANLHPTIFTPIQCDVTSHASLQAAVDSIGSETGYINLLIANSGITGPHERWDPSLPLSEVRSNLFSQAAMDATTSTFHVNTTGALFTMVAFLGLLDAGNKRAIQGGLESNEFGAPLLPSSDVPSIQSQVIVVSSISAYSRMAMSAPAYAGSKVAILHLTKQASSNLAGYGIRANALAPGLFPTELASVLIGGRDPGTETHDDPLFIPSRRFGGEEEMAGTLLYLASRAGAYCNGTVLMMDGGRLGVMQSSY
ncbi:NAD(P)-binding protein [Parathielavia appendiculata]|uniref:NAD(P)-binding protein n=1 Tax=Parathielavia appendiculata TaxID=2587402 RepID=A0AAN6TQ64_9PEZI|nr:NAD(P)-binding protein [Parathielavia appendiculata]